MSTPFRIHPPEHPVRQLMLDMGFDLATWDRAVADRNWRWRAQELSKAIAAEICAWLAKGETIQETGNRTITKLAAVLEKLNEPEINSPEAAVYYYFTHHENWRSSAIDFIRINQFNLQTLIDYNAGLQLLSAILNTHREFKKGLN